MQEFGDVLYSWTAAIPLITTGISALSGLFGKKQQQQQQGTIDQTQTSNQSQNYNNSTMPTYAGYEGKIKNYILGNLINRTQRSTDMSPYLAQYIKNINNASALKRQALASTLAARGLSGSPMGAIAENALESGRIGEIVNTEAQMPILQRQFQNEDMDALSKFFQSLPVGNQTSGTSSSQGTTTTKGTTTGNYTGSAGGGVGDMLSGLGQGLASTYGLNYWLQQLAKQKQATLPGGTIQGPNEGSGE